GQQADVDAPAHRGQEEHGNGEQEEDRLLPAQRGAGAPEEERSRQEQEPADRRLDQERNREVAPPSLGGILAEEKSQMSPFLVGQHAGESTPPGRESLEEIDDRDHEDGGDEEKREGRHGPAQSLTRARRRFFALRDAGGAGETELAATGEDVAQDHDRRDRNQQNGGELRAEREPDGGSRAGEERPGGGGRML